MRTMALAPLRERRKAARLLWPFLRVAGATPAAAEALAREGIAPCDLARPDTRIPHRAVMSILDAWIAGTGDEAIGLRAGQGVEPGDLEVVEYAARSCATLREAIHCAARYVHLVDEAAKISLLEHEDRALWRVRVDDGVPQSRASNDFVVACAARFA